MAENMSKACLGWKTTQSLTKSTQPSESLSPCISKESNLQGFVVASMTQPREAVENL